MGIGRSRVPPDDRAVTVCCDGTKIGAEYGRRPWAVLPQVESGHPPRQKQSVCKAQRVGGFFAAPTTLPANSSRPAVGSKRALSRLCQSRGFASRRALCVQGAGGLEAASGGATSDEGDRGPIRLAPQNQSTVVCRSLKKNLQLPPIPARTPLQHLSSRCTGLPAAHPSTC